MCNPLSYGVGSNLSSRNIFLTLKILLRQNVKNISRVKYEKPATQKCGLSLKETVGMGQHDNKILIDIYHEISRQKMAHLTNINLKSFSKNNDFTSLGDVIIL